MKKSLIYDKKYYQSNNQNKDRPALKFYTKVFKKYLKSGVVLDYGAGEGFLCKHLNKYFKTYAFDISKYSKIAIKNNSKKTIFVEDINKIIFDGIISLHTLEHIKNPEDILKKFSNVIKKDGILMIVVPNPNGLGYMIKKDDWFGFRDDTHVSLFESNKWKKIIKDSGFEIIKTSSDGFWDVPYIKHIPIILQKLFFWPSAFLLIVLNKLLYPDWFGECLIVVAKKI